MGQTTGGSGFRLDAIKHMDREFLLQWVSRLTKPYRDALVTIRLAQIKQVRGGDGRSRAFMVAEYWSTKSVWIYFHPMSIANLCLHRILRVLYYLKMFRGEVCGFPWTVSFAS